MSLADKDLPGWMWAILVPLALVVLALGLWPDEIAHALRRIAGCLE